MKYALRRNGRPAPRMVAGSMTSPNTWQHTLMPERYDSKKEAREEANKRNKKATGTVVYEVRKVKK